MEPAETVEQRAPLVLAERGARHAEAELTATDLLEDVQVLPGPLGDRHRHLAHALGIEQLLEQFASGPGHREAGQGIASEPADGARDVDAASARLVARGPAPELPVGKDVGDAGALVDGRVHGERRDREHRGHDGVQ